VPEAALFSIPAARANLRGRLMLDTIVGWPVMVAWLLLTACLTVALYMASR
jgi:hypothetical protein